MLDEAHRQSLTVFKERLVYIDETPELAASFGQDVYSTDAVVSSDQDGDGSQLASQVATMKLSKSPHERDSYRSTPSSSVENEIWDSISVGREINDILISNEFHLHKPSSWEPDASYLAHSSIYDPKPTDSHMSNISLMGGLVRHPSTESTTFHFGKLEFVLFRYFIDNLARWFDVCDPERHFEFIVPQRARWCPPLMNAILAASARHLTRVQKHQTPSSTVHYDGTPLLELKTETALQYHSECIKDLLRLSMDPDQTKSENLLAAAIILRFYEEIDYPLQDEKRDSELFLRVINFFVDAQIPTAPFKQHPPDSDFSTCPEDYTNSPDGVQATPLCDFTSAWQTFLEPQKRWYTGDLRQAAFWVAFRQEVYSAFLKQRPFNMSLSRCEVFRSLSPAEDALWAARLIIFCADVLESYHGNSVNGENATISTGQTARDKWFQFKELEKTLIGALPASFEPIYYHEPDRGRGEVFPEICYLTNYHVVGVQHVELARILLAVYDPTRPKLGLQYAASMRDLSQKLRTIVLRLCGIAVSNRSNSPGLTTALLGIVVCGDHFEDRLEQEALLSVLNEIEEAHGWPLGNSREKLKQAWGWI